MPLDIEAQLKAAKKLAEDITNEYKKQEEIIKNMTAAGVTVSQTEKDKLTTLRNQQTEQGKIVTQLEAIAQPMKTIIGLYENAGKLTTEWGNSQDRLKQKAEQYLNVMQNLPKALMDSNSLIDKATGAMLNFVAAPLAQMLESSGKLDAVSGPIRDLRANLINLESGFGKGFRDSIVDLDKYRNSIAATSSVTYEGAGAIQAHMKTLAAAGITVDQLTRNYDAAGAKVNLLTQTLFLAKESGMEHKTVMDMHVDSLRKMGLAAEESGKPMAELLAISRQTNLPMNELKSTVYDTAVQYTRFGMTVDSISPIVKKFNETLGPGRQAFAGELTKELVGGLAAKAGTGEAAFMAMRGGMVGPGDDPLKAMLAYEKNLATPEKNVEAMAKTMQGLFGQTRTREEAYEGTNADRTAFMQQRQFIQQQTGVSDVQKLNQLQEFIKNIQMGGSMEGAGAQSVADLLKSGQEKEDESRGLQEKIAKNIELMEFTLSTKISNRLDQMIQNSPLAPQNASGLIRGQISPMENDMEKYMAQGLEKKLSEGKEFFNEAINKAKQTQGKDYLGEGGNQINNATNFRRPGFFEAPEYTMGKQERRDDYGSGAKQLEAVPKSIKEFLEKHQMIKQLEAVPKSIKEFLEKHQMIQTESDQKKNAPISNLTAIRKAETIELAEQEAAKPVAKKDQLAAAAEKQMSALMDVLKQMKIDINIASTDDLAQTLKGMITATINRASKRGDA